MERDCKTCTIGGGASCEGCDKPDIWSKGQRNTYLLLIVVLGILSAVNVYMPMGEIPGVDMELPMPKHVFAIATFFIMVILYGGLGYAALRLNPGLDLPGMWGKGEGFRNLVGKAAFYGIVLAVLFIFIDIMAAPLNGVGRLMHPPFPTSLVASTVAGIGEELMFRLVVITFLMWIFDKLFRSGARSGAFWTAAVIAALMFSVVHVPFVIAVAGRKEIQQFPPLLLVELIVLNGSLSLAAADLYRKHGIVAAMVIHFVLDIVWHVVYGLYG